MGGGSERRPRSQWWGACGRRRAVGSQPRSSQTEACCPSTGRPSSRPRPIRSSPGTLELREHFYYLMDLFNRTAVVQDEGGSLSPNPQADLARGVDATRRRRGVGSVVLRGLDVSECGR
jgi:hypothetical protein